MPRSSNWARRAWKTSSSFGPRTRSAKRSPRRASTARMRRTSQRSVPTPKIIGERAKASRSRCRRRIDDAPVGADRLGHAELERVGDEGVADRDLEDARDGGEKGAEVVAVEVVAGVDAETDRLRGARSGAEGDERRCLNRRAPPLRVGPGVELDAV